VQDFVVFSGYGRIDLFEEFLFDPAKEAGTTRPFAHDRLLSQAQEMTKVTVEGDNPTEVRTAVRGTEMTAIAKVGRKACVRVEFRKLSTIVDNRQFT
jgi:hypothetical protein